MRALPFSGHPWLRALAVAAAAAAITAGVSCSSDDENVLQTANEGGGGAAGTGGAGGGTSSAIACPTAPMVSGCTVAVAPSSDDYTTIQTALGEAQAGDTICFCPGNYELTRQISLDVENVTVRGAGAAVSDVVLDFKNQTTGDDGFTVTSNGFDVENLTLKNTPGNGIVVTGVTGVTFRDLKVYWDAGSVVTNGAYAVYPTASHDVLIERVEVVGAADAGIYVGQCYDAIVRNCTVHGCVAGVESENTTDMEIHDNEVYDNTGGILVFALPNLMKKDALRTNVHDNNVHDNNRANFAEAMSVVSYVPEGIGILVLAADYAEVHSNTVTNEDTGGVVVVSLNTFDALGAGGTPDPETDPYPEHDYIHDNTYTNIGANPASPLSLLPTRPVEEVLWDGDEASPGSAMLCLGTTNLPTFRDVNGVNNIGNSSMQSTDTTMFQCDGMVLTPITF